MECGGGVNDLFVSVVIVSVSINSVLDELVSVTGFTGSVSTILLIGSSTTSNAVQRSCDVT